MQANLLAIRQGEVTELKGEYPAELRPVADELNLSPHLMKKHD